MVTIHELISANVSWIQQLHTSHIYRELVVVVGDVHATRVFHSLHTKAATTYVRYTCEYAEHAVLGAYEGIAGGRMWCDDVKARVHASAHSLVS